MSTDDIEFDDTDVFVFSELELGEPIYVTDEQWDQFQELLERKEDDSPKLRALFSQAPKFLRGD